MKSFLALTLFLSLIVKVIPDNVLPIPVGRLIHKILFVFKFNLLKLEQISL